LKLEKSKAYGKIYAYLLKTHFIKPQEPNASGKPAGPAPQVQKPDTQAASAQEETVKPQ
jgi:hypothetical protein